jgi:heptaprenyl diphosphate synthase
LIPYGEILFSIGPLSITSGALWGGIRRAVTLEGLFMLSRCCVRKDLILPGAFGEIAGDAFRVFSDMSEHSAAAREGLVNERPRRSLFRNWLLLLDRLLISYAQSEGGNAVKNAPKKPPGRITGPRMILAAVVILAWLPVIKELFRNFSF